MGGLDLKVLCWSKTGQVVICLWGMMSNLICFTCFLAFAVWFWFLFYPSSFNIINCLCLDPWVFSHLHFLFSLPLLLGMEVEGVFTAAAWVKTTTYALCEKDCWQEVCACKGRKKILSLWGKTRKISSSGGSEI